MSYRKQGSMRARDRHNDCEGEKKRIYRFMEREYKKKKHDNSPVAQNSVPRSKTNLISLGL